MANINVLGYPSSAGAYCVGVEHSPAALRDAGLVAALQSAGHEVTDLGDLPVHLWRPDQERPLAQNLDEEVEALRVLVDAAAPLVTTDDRLLVLGGSCTVALGLCGAVASAGIEPHLVYVDRHLDLNTPDSTTEGSLSWMGMAHALDLPGAEESLVGLGGPGPVLQAEHLVYLGVELSGETTEWERDQVDRLGITVTTQAELVADPTAAALQARGALPDGPFVPAHAASDPTSLGRLVEALTPPSDA